ncbi:MAG TPA: class I SAM-dependent methyltransferase, partial [Terrimicrobiaceae bacterium]|nr:class I SAM-dependent methyltransferase [Terrimicrobiaceae bacterium]
MDRTYWEKVAADYDGEIFDSFARARGRILTKRLDEFADASAPAADAGCGVGKYLPAMSERFRSVDAYDLSSGLLRQAKRAAAGCRNVRFFRRDFSKRPARIAPVRFALCANVLIMPSLAVREAVLCTLRRMVEPGGHALFLVPSLESALLVHHRIVEWNRRDGMDPDAAVRASGAPAAKASAQALRQGLVPLAG